LSEAPAATMRDAADAEMDELTIAVLAGGRSERMGRDKALLDWGGRPLLAHILALARSACAEAAGDSPRVFIVGNPGLFADDVSGSSSSPAFEGGAPCWPDRIAGVGPLGGILTALDHAPGARVLALACDMPFVTAEGLRRLWRLSSDTGGWTVPRTKTAAGAPGLEPLCAVYDRALAAPIEAAIEAGVFKIEHALRDVPTRIVEPDELGIVAGEFFRNVNRRDEYERWRPTPASG
jgi:molybdopterin-guanine dinucleotide biosynthesis protein A